MTNRYLSALLISVILFCLVTAAANFCITKKIQEIDRRVEAVDRWITEKRMVER